MGYASPNTSDPPKRLTFGSEPLISNHSVKIALGLFTITLFLMWLQGLKQISPPFLLVILLTVGVIALTNVPSGINHRKLRFLIPALQFVLFLILSDSVVTEEIVIQTGFFILLFWWLSGTWKRRLVEIGKSSLLKNHLLCVVIASLLFFALLPTVLDYKVSVDLRIVLGLLTLALSFVGLFSLDRWRIQLNPPRKEYLLLKTALGSQLIFQLLVLADIILHGLVGSH